MRTPNVRSLLFFLSVAIACARSAISSTPEALLRSEGVALVKLWVKQRFRPSRSTPIPWPQDRCSHIYPPSPLGNAWIKRIGFGSCGALRRTSLQRCQVRQGVSAPHRALTRGEPPLASARAHSNPPRPRKNRCRSPVTFESPHGDH